MTLVCLIELMLLEEKYCIYKRLAMFSHVCTESSYIHFDTKNTHFQTCPEAQKYFKFQRVCYACNEYPSENVSEHEKRPFIN
jgi:hypothetical protein